MTAEETGFNPCFNGSMYKNTKQSQLLAKNYLVSILVLMDLCIKTSPISPSHLSTPSFNPCFNGSMYKNWAKGMSGYIDTRVSILVLMDLCIKTVYLQELIPKVKYVSILVLMDLCIKTTLAGLSAWEKESFNPCFNGSMYKNSKKA